MEMLARLRAELTMLERKFAEFRQSWRQHLHWIAEQNERIVEEYPTTLTPGAWATQYAISQALHRLSAIELALAARSEALTMRGMACHHTSLESQILYAMQRAPVSSETRSWQFISVIAEVEDGLDDERDDIHAAELRLSERIDLIQQSLNELSGTVKSKNFALLCKVQKLRDGLEQKLLEFPHLADDQDDCLERQIDRLHEFIHKRGNLETGLLYFTFILSEVGVRIARQTLITEYFEVSCTGIAEDIEMDDDSEIEDVTEVENNIEMEGDIEMGD
jgi:hypothetical protein